MAGTLLAVPAIGFTTIFAVLRFPNFALSGLIAVGAYAGLMANTIGGWPLAATLPVAFLVSGAIGVATDKLMISGLRPAGPLAAAIGSIALALLMENVLRFTFGDRKGNLLKGVTVTTDEKDVEPVVLKLIVDIHDPVTVVTWTRDHHEVRRVEP